MSTDKATFLRERGWSLWYNENYWVNPKTIIDPNVQDYTNYGLSLEDAYLFETENGKPFRSIAPIERCLSSLYPDGKLTALVQAQPPEPSA